MLMNLVLDKYIIPNANSQFDLLTKLRMSGVYASVYGAQPILYDYRIDDEYVGPDCWLIPVRSFLPQPGKNSIRDMDWCMVSKIESVSFLKSILKRKSTVWNTKEIAKLVELVKDGATPTQDVDSSKQSAVETTRKTGIPNPGIDGDARIELVTKYEKGKAGKWITFAPDYPQIGPLRSITNPHKNGRIPIVMRQCFPLIDSIYGLGDFERGLTLQKAKDSLINLYMDAVKLSIFPPLKIDLSGVTASTIRWEAGARWLMSDLNAVQPFTSSPIGMETFQGTYQFLTTALLNQNGTTSTNTSTQESANSAIGKTPQAIEAQQATENARDNWDRFMLEQTTGDLFEGMLNLVGEMQEKPIDLHIFDEDIQDILDQYEGDEDDGTPSYMTKMNSNVAKITIIKSKIKGSYIFKVDESSSLSSDNKAENEQLVSLNTFYLQNPQAIDQMLQRDGYKFNFGKSMERQVITSGITDWDDIIDEISPEEQQQNAMAQQQQMAAQQPQGMPQAQPQQPQGAPQDQSATPPQFTDPHIAAAAQAMFGNHPSVGQNPMSQNNGGQA